MSEFSDDSLGQTSDLSRRSDKIHIPGPVDDSVGAVLALHA